MRHPLKLHPDCTCDAIKRIDVAVKRRTKRLLLTYLLTGETDALLLPQPASPVRTDGLWQHTCLEAFVREQGTLAYREFNFAPSTAWAAYDFTAYREGMENASVQPAKIETYQTRGAYTLTAEVECDTAASLQVALSAVIEEPGGRKSYWALAHPPGKPDFHHLVGFALALAKADSA